MSETKLNFTRNLLFAPDCNDCDQEKLYVIKNFCGQVFHQKSNLQEYLREKNREKSNLYWLGKTVGYDLNDILGDSTNHCELGEIKVFVVKEYCDKCWKGCCHISLGQVPINYYGVGVLFRRFFEKNYFKEIQTEHRFQNLTESNKSGSAYRKGIYLSDVVEKKDKNELEFHLLRCSTNLQGPTDQLSLSDREIIRSVNEIAADFFDAPAPLNHVLAQIYYNKRDETTKKEVKAKISRHSDKTKDMPANGLIAFTSFYDFDMHYFFAQDRDAFLDAHSYAQDSFDLRYDHKVSILTQLEFLLKDPETYPHLEKCFRVTLYPNSVFLISLETNRLYTHEIKPPVLPVEKIPTRMGYVIRCSKQKAIYRGGKTFLIDEDGNQVDMKDIDNKDMTLIKDFYWQENSSTSIVKYPFIRSSLNQGDYLPPNCLLGSTASNH